MLRIFKSSTPLKLGRWSLSSSKKIIDRKVELANHDHCGPCPPLKKSNHNYDLFDNSMDLSIYALQSFHVAPSKKSRKINFDGI